MNARSNFSDALVPVAVCKVDDLVPGIVFQTDAEVIQQRDQNQAGDRRHVRRHQEDIATGRDHESPRRRRRLHVDRKSVV